MTIDEALAALPVVAITRGLKPDEAVAVGEALYDGGVRAMEVPLNSPEPLESIARLSRRFGDAMAIGAGTVLAPEAVAAVDGAGGRFIVSPNTDASVIAQAIALGLEPLPGFATASEAFSAIQAGARFLKLFPASTYGPGHLKALKAVTPPQISILAVGGVGPDAFPGWLAAGAGGFGLGSELYAPGLSAPAVSERLARCLATLSNY